MKKILLLVTIFSMVFTSCDPLEDIYSEIDSNESDAIVGVTSYTLTEEDYTEGLEDGGLGLENEYFDSEEHAEGSLPSFLADKYPVWGENDDESSLVNVTYNLFSPSLLEEMSTSTTLASINDINGYLGSDYETALNGTFVELTYSATVLAYELSDDDFETIGNALNSSYPTAAENAANYGNFDRRDSKATYWSDSMILEGFNELLGSSYNVGQVVVVSFAIYDGGTNWSESFTVQYKGYGFAKLDVEVDAVTATEYTLSGTDYDAIAADTDLSTEYPDPTSNLGKYGNFNVDENSPNYWSDEMILEGLNLILPAATEGDVYAVTYDTYNSGNGTETMTLLYTSGAYILNTTTVEIASIVAKNDGDWEFPYVFSDADYDLLGQSYGTFDSGAIYKLDIFLESLYPLAAPGDTANVMYQYYNGDENTKYGTSIFDGNNWNLTLDVIDSSVQYGFEDGNWLPDNTINYTFLSADYVTVGSSTELASDNTTTLADGSTADYTDVLDNLNTYGNFNRNNGSTHWEDEMIVKAIAVVLNQIDPNAEDGQKYSVTISTYGATRTETFKLIKESGTWVDNN